MSCPEISTKSWWKQAQNQVFEEALTDVLKAAQKYENKVARNHSLKVARGKHLHGFVFVRL